MPVDVQARTSPDLQEIERIETQVPLRVRLVLKDGNVHQEDAARLLTRLLKTVQDLVRE